MQQAAPHEAKPPKYHRDARASAAIPRRRWLPGRSAPARIPSPTRTGRAAPAPGSKPVRHPRPAQPIRPRGSGRDRIRGGADETTPPCALKGPRWHGPAAERWVPLPRSAGCADLGACCVGRPDAPRTPPTPRARGFTAPLPRTRAPQVGVPPGHVQL